MKAKAVVFDLGNVLLAFNYDRAVRRLQFRSKISAPEMRSLMEHSPLLVRFETGEMTVEEFFTAVRDPSGFDGSFGEFAEIFADIFVPIDAMVRLHAQLRAQGIPTHIFSNTNQIAIDFVRRQFPFFREFDQYVLSYEHGAMKPNPKLYEVVEEAAGLNGSELIYIDDRPENVEAGAARGWNAILHERPDRTIERLRAAGMTI